MLTTLIEEARESCWESLRQPDLVAVEKALKHSGTSPDDCAALVRSVADGGARQAVVKLKQNVPSFGDGSGGELERFLLIQAALRTIDDVPELPVSTDVKRLFCDAFRYFARVPNKRSRSSFEAGRSSFVSMCKIATLKRFPAGEYEWEVSGLPRSWLLRIQRNALPRVALFVARAKGFSPLFYPHLGVLRPKRIMLVESEINRSYYRMAQSLAMQPGVKGLIASAWFFSPDISRVSPHLAWLAQFFLDNGGIVANMGAAGPEASGVLSRSNKRKELYQAGQLHPTLGLVLWPRKQMLRWAAAHPEYGG